MKILHRRNLITLAALTVLLIVALPIVGSAQGRGRGRGSSQWDRKCEKFVNCHDARDGRWDNRGPNRNGAVYSSAYRRNRRYNDSYYRRNRYSQREYSTVWHSRRHHRR